MKYFNTKICRKKCMPFIPFWCLYMFCYCCKYSIKKNLKEIGVIEDGCKKYIIIQIGDTLIRKERDNKEKRRETKKTKKLFPKK